MRAIALETSERFGTLAALSTQDAKTELLYTKQLPSDQRTAQSLLPVLQELLEECGWDARDLDLICTTTGPGSFTGLRLGVTTAKTLAYATGAELVGVSTLAAIAAGVNSDDKRLWAILDAQRRELFAACFTPGWQTRRQDAPVIRVLGVHDWLKRLRVGDFVVGPPLKKLGDSLPSGVETVDPQLWVPQAATVGRLGIDAYQAGETVDPMQLVPKYYRKSAAEEKTERVKD